MTSLRTCLICLTIHSADSHVGMGPYTHIVCCKTVSLGLFPVNIAASKPLNNPLAIIVVKWSQQSAQVNSYPCASQSLPKHFSGHNRNAKNGSRSSSFVVTILFYVWILIIFSQHAYLCYCTRGILIIVHDLAIHITDVSIIMMSFIKRSVV